MQKKNKQKNMITLPCVQMCFRKIIIKGEPHLVKKSKKSDELEL